MSPLKSLLRYGYVPLMLLGLNGLAYLIVNYEFSSLWLLPLLLFAFGFTHLAERVSPWHAEWNDSHYDDNTNICHIVVYELSNLNGMLSIPLIVWLFPFQGIWPTEWPLLVQWLIALVIADFAFVFVHMLSHKIPLLWRLHAVHHGVSRLYGFNGLVRHPVHQSLDMIVGTMPLVILGMPLNVAILLGFAVSVQLIIQHANIAYELGPFRNLFSIGKIHHIHHVNWGKEGDCNYGLFLTLWDRLFGTFVTEPSRPIMANDMGIDEVPHFPKSYWEQLLFPIIYKPGAGEPERYRVPESSDDNGK